MLFKKSCAIIIRSHLDHLHLFSRQNGSLEDDLVLEAPV